MSLITLLVVLALLGLITWAIITYVPMPAGIKNLIIVVAVVCAVLYVLGAIGVGLPNLRVPQVK